MSLFCHQINFVPSGKSSLNFYVKSMLASDNCSTWLASFTGHGKWYMDSCTFLCCILDLMDTLPQPAPCCHLTTEFHSYLEWWHEFLNVFNGQCDFVSECPVTSLRTDDCTNGLNAWWCHTWHNKTVFVYCDNTVAVAILSKRTKKGYKMMHFLRGLFWLSAVYNFHIKAFHVAGKHNVVADNISRLHEPLQLQGFFSYLLISDSNEANISAVFHMSGATQFWLLGTYSLPLI